MRPMQRLCLKTRSARHFDLCNEYYSKIEVCQQYSYLSFVFLLRVTCCWRVIRTSWWCCWTRSTHCLCVLIPVSFRGCSASSLTYPSVNKRRCTSWSSVLNPAVTSTSMEFVHLCNLELSLFFVTIVKFCSIKHNLFSYTGMMRSTVQMTRSFWTASVK